MSFAPWLWVHYNNTPDNLTRYIPACAVETLHYMIFWNVLVEAVMSYKFFETLTFDTLT